MYLSLMRRPTNGWHNDISDTVRSTGERQTPPLDKTPSIMLNFGWHLTVLGEVSIFVGYAYAINGHFVRHKQTGNKIGASSIIV